MVVSCGPPIFGTRPNARLYEYVMPFGIYCSPPVYQFSNLPISCRAQLDPTAAAVSRFNFHIRLLFKDIRLLYAFTQLHGSFSMSKPSFLGRWDPHQHRKITIGERWRSVAVGAYVARGSAWCTVVSTCTDGRVGLSHSIYVIFNVLVCICMNE